MTERDGGFSEPVGGRGRDGPHHPEQEERSRVESLLPISSQALRMTGWGGGYGSGAVVEYCAIADPGFLNKKFRNDTFDVSVADTKFSAASDYCASGGRVPPGGIVIDPRGSMIGFANAASGARQVWLLVKRRMAVSMLRSETAAV